jgi:nucleoside-diphosphate-sugar epimerase
MRCLVVGSTGFVGSHLVPALRAAGFAVVTASNEAAPREDPGHATHAVLDVGDVEAVREVVRRAAPEVVVNLAALATGSPDQMCRVNVLGPLCLLDALRACAPEAHLIAFGSAAEYGEAGASDGPLDEATACLPVGPYGVTKLAGTRAALGLAAAWGVRVAVLRPFNIVGAGCPPTLFVGAVIARLLASGGAAGAEVAVGRVDTYRDFIAVEDVADAVVGVARARPPTGIYNVSGGRPVLIRDALEELLRISGRAAAWRTDPALVRPSDPRMSYGTSAKLARATGFAPRVPLADALRAAWEHAAARFPTGGEK